MNWEVTIKQGEVEKTYPISEESPYSAKVSAARKFLEDFEIPGTPSKLATDTINTQISVRSLEDKRKVRSSYNSKFYVDQIDRLRRLVRQGDMDGSTKEKATRLLFDLREVLGG